MSETEPCSSVPTKSGNRSFPPLLLGIDISENPKIQREACSIIHNAILPVGKREKLLSEDHPPFSACTHTAPTVGNDKPAILAKKSESPWPNPTDD
ncbi:hypothetical protein HZ326_25490 [Fusarium oxysporum f. sp. albedinis]|nr:hypothetical protein HZ326_25490 [Fusarium oxysporum f. sp. albedinis]